MSFFEPSTRIPLIIRTPAGDGERGVTVADHVSLQDVLPTLVELAGGDPTDDLGHPVDGASLVPQLLGDRDPDRTVLGEYLGEGAIAPIFMIRRRQYKYVWSDPDDPQLYDLAADPDETRNLAGHPDHAATAAAFRAEIDKHWQPARVHEQVVASQRARRVVDRALRVGRYTPWDHTPVPDAANQYMRNHLDLRDVETSRRHPPPVPRPIGPTAG
jgi:choline-sulfatase